MDMLPVDHAVKQDLLRQIRELMNSYDRIRDVAGHPVELQGDYIQSCKMEPVQLWNGIVPVQVGIDDRYYYEMLSGMLGENVEDEYQLLNETKRVGRNEKGIYEGAGCIVHGEDQRLRRCDSGQRRHCTGETGIDPTWQQVSVSKSRPAAPPYI